MFNSIDNFKFIFTEISKWNHFQCITAIIIAIIMVCAIAIICLTVIHCNSEKEITKIFKNYNETCKEIIKSNNSTHAEVNKSNNDALNKSIKNLKNQKKTDK